MLNADPKGAQSESTKHLRAATETLRSFVAQGNIHRIQADIPLGR